MNQSTSYNKVLSYVSLLLNDKQDMNVLLQNAVEAVRRDDVKYGKDASNTDILNNQSVQILKETYTKDPQNHFITKLLAETYFSFRRYDEVIDYCDKSIALSPTDSDCYYMRGVSQDYLRMYQDALLSLQTAISLDNRQFKFYHSLAIVYDHLGQHDEALEAINIALEKHPGYTPAQKSKQIILRNIQSKGSTTNY